MRARTRGSHAARTPRRTRRPAWGRRRTGSTRAGWRRTPGPRPPPRRPRGGAPPWPARRPRARAHRAADSEHGACDPGVRARGDVLAGVGGLVVDLADLLADRIAGHVDR